MIRIPTHRAPTHPGEMLVEEFLIPLGITQHELAQAIHISCQRVDEIINKQQEITPREALRLAKFLGMSADFWMNLQLRWNLYYAEQAEGRILQQIQPYTSLAHAAQ